MVITFLKWHLILFPTMMIWMQCIVIVNFENIQYKVQYKLPYLQKQYYEAHSNRVKFGRIVFTELRYI